MAARNWADLNDDERAVLAVLDRYPLGASVREIADELEEPGRRKRRWTNGKVRGNLEKLSTAGFALRKTEHPSRAVAYTPTAKPSNPATFPPEDGGTLGQDDE